MKEFKYLLSEGLINPSTVSVYCGTLFPSKAEISVNDLVKSFHITCPDLPGEIVTVGAGLGFAT